RSEVYSELLRKSMYFKFATRYAADHKEAPSSFNADTLTGQFRRFLHEEKFTFQDEGERKLGELSETAHKLKYSAQVVDELDQLKKRFEEEKSKSLDRDKDDIGNALKIEIMSRYKGEHGRIETSLASDTQLKAARSL